MYGQDAISNMIQTKPNIKLESFPIETIITNQISTKFSVQVSCITTNTARNLPISVKSNYV